MERNATVRRFDTAEAPHLRVLNPSGHVSIETTNIYAEIDLATKAKALATCAVQPDESGPPVWKDNRDLLAFLRSL